MLVSDLMNPDPVTILDTTSLQEALLVLRDNPNGNGFIPVVDRDGQIAAVFDQSCAINALAQEAERQGLVIRWCRRDFPTIPAWAPLSPSEVTPDYLLVVNEKRQLVGTVNEAEIWWGLWREASRLMEEKSKPNGGGKDWSQAEMEEIRRLNRELDSIIEASYDGIFITDGQGRVIRVNSSWERITGVSRKYAVGKTAQYMVSRGLYSRSAAVAALKEKKRVTTMLEMTQGKKRGQKIIATGTPIWGEEGEIKMVVVDVRDVTELVSLKQQLEETQRLNQRYTAQLGQMRAQQARYDDIVTGSGVMKRVMEITAQAARVDSTVLITGESGVGKEVIARAIHRLSPRSEGPMITINCGAIPENLLESELFGYEAGAFTGANKQGKPGMFELADKGTLFLDEVGELPINLQVKLLRVLQDHEVMRVGGLSPIAVDTRIVAATNKDLLEMVGHGKFREDLFYRLNVVSIEVPPLRERREDIPPLALHCLEKVNRKYGFQKRLSPAVIDRFLTYSWPGNVRELENVIERMVVMAGGEEILAEHLPAYLSGRNGPADGRVDVHGIIPLKTALEQVERQLISEALEMYGSTRKAARVLEVNQSTIVRKAGKYRILSSGGLEGL